MNLCSLFIRNVSKLDKCLRCTHNLSWNVHSNIKLDTDYLCDERNTAQIEQNILKRKGIGDIKLVNSLKSKLEGMSPSDATYNSTHDQFYAELLKIPNQTHPNVIHYQDEAIIVRSIGQKKEFASEPKQFYEIAKRLKLIRTDQLGAVCGSKSYFLLGDLAKLEQALVRYVVNILLKNDFQLISVPDILHRNIIEGCGMNTRGTRSQVYSLESTLHGPDLCLSGTSEMALAGHLSNKLLSQAELPVKLAAISRCYRAETSNLAEERGIYRVHEFTKVEMFIASTPNASAQLLEDIRRIQEDCFQSLGLHFLVLDMPPHELGAQAYRKYDVEAWLSGHKRYGEISSCSNCIDYQSRRLNITYQAKTGDSFVHTLNGTACAIPRLLIALIESGQNNDGTVSIPEVLHKYMGKSVISKQKKIPELKLIKNKKYLCFFIVNTLCLCIYI